MTTSSSSSSSTRWRVRFLSIIVVFMLVVSACTWNWGDPSGLCECPNLEATAGSIDWIGDGTVPDEVLSSVERDPLGLKVLIFYNTPDRIELQVEVEERPRAAGFTVTDPTPFSGLVEEDEWSMSVTTSGTEENPMIGVRVDIVDDDARAAEILAPLVDALGSLP